MGNQIHLNSSENPSRARRRRRTLAAQGGAAAPSVIEMLEKRQMFSGSVLVWNATAAAAAATTADGPLTWDTTTTEWTNQATGDPASWSNAGLGGGCEQAVFPAGMDPASILVSGPIDVASIEFESSGIALSGNSLVLPSTGGSIDPLVGWSEIDSSIQGGPLSVGGGGATLILGGSNSYTGGTTAPSTLITAGTLQVGRLGSSNTLGNSTLGAGAVNLSSGATLAFDLNTPTTFSNNIQLSSGSQTISILGSTTTLSGVISGGGSVVVGNPIGGGGSDGDGGSGTPGDPQPDLVMGGSNTYTGSTLVTDGADVSIPGSIASNNVVIDPDSSLAAQPDSFDSAPTMVDNGTMDYDDPTPSEDPVGDPQPIQFSGFGLLSVQGGALNLIGTNTFSGTTNVSYGILSMQNSATVNTDSSSTTVLAGSTLDGNGGTQGAVTVANGGFLTPGTRNGIGMEQPAILNSGSVTFQAGGTFAATINNQVTPGTDYDQLDVNGTVNIDNGSFLNLNGVIAVQDAGQITLIKSTGGITGSFQQAEIDPSNPTALPQITADGQTFSVNYSGGTDHDDLVLTLIYSSPVLSIVQQDASITVGQPTNFELTAVGDLGRQITAWNVVFGDDSANVISISRLPDLAAGGIYKWDVQHTFTISSPETVSYLISATPVYNESYYPVVPAQLQVNVNPAPSTAVITVTGAIPQSSTQMNVYFVTTQAIDSSEIAAEDTTATTFTVVAAGGAVASNSGDVVLVNGLTPGDTYKFLVYGVTAGGSICSYNDPLVSNRTFAAPTLSESGRGGTYTYTATFDYYSENYQTQGGASPQYQDLLNPSMQAFDGSGQPLPTTWTTSDDTCTAVFNTNPAYVTFDTTAATIYNPSQASGAFDSLTYYNIVPTIVVTGTAANNTFTVSINSETGEYQITGSVTPIAPFYAPAGIALELDGRGGTDHLDVTNGAVVGFATDPFADGTDFSADADAASTLHSYQPPRTPWNVPPPADLTLPAPDSNPYDTVPTAGDTFTPPVSSAISGPDEIQQATATAEPRDVIALTADNVITIPGMGSPGGSSPDNEPTSYEPTQFWVYGQTSSGDADWSQASVISEASAGSDSSGTLMAVSLQLPVNLPAHSVYFLYEVNFKTDPITSAVTTTYSQPNVINQPQVWWTSSANSHQDGTASVFGTNLSYGLNPSPYADQSWVYLFPSDQNGTITPGAAPIILPETAVAADPISGAGAMDVNEYKVDFKLPANVTANIYYYQVEIYNGHGGWYGMSHAVAGLNSPTMITVPAALVTQTYPLLSAVDGYAAWKGVDSISIYDGSSAQLSPTAVNDAISWANDQAESSGYSFVNIQLPPGLIEVTDTSDIVKMAAYVHLIGAGDTGNSLTGTVIEAEYGAGVEGLVEFPSIPAPNESGNTGLSDMSLDANGGINVNADGEALGGVIFDEGQLTGLTLERLTIDATNDDPSQPNFVGQNVLDLHINGGATYLQILDSTLIGAGLYGELADAVIDNCHFIGCGTVGVVIVMQDSTDVSITRCTDTSLVNNILNPGGDVEGDSNKGLLDAAGTQPGLYIGNNSTSDVYNSDPHGDGEQVSVEAANYPLYSSEPDQVYNSAVVVYQNTISGDGAESLGRESIGILVQPGYNIVVADNDISNVGYAISTYNNNGNYNASYLPPGYLKTHMPFAMYVGNSIHNVDTGINLPIGPVPTEQNQPWFIGCSFSGNIISGGQPGSTGIQITTYAAESNNPPQILMNVFNRDIITGVGVAIAIPELQGVPPNQIGSIVFSDGWLLSDGSVSSSAELYDATNPPNPLTLLNSLWQDFWNLPSH